MKPNQLKECFIQFSITFTRLCKHLDKSFASKHLAKQLIRSAISSALNYGKYTRDFLHKIKLCLKELRGSYINLRIQKGANTITDLIALDKLLNENNELISIFVKSIKTVSIKTK